MGQRLVRTHVTPPTHHSVGQLASVVTVTSSTQNFCCAANGIPHPPLELRRKLKFVGRPESAGSRHTVTCVYAAATGSTPSPGLEKTLDSMERPARFAGS